MQLLVISTITVFILGCGASVDALRCYQKTNSLGEQTVAVCGEGSNICNIELDKNGAGTTRVVARGCGKKNSYMDTNLYYGDNGYQPGCWKKKSTRPGAPDEVTCFCETDLCNGENDLIVLTTLFADTLANKRPLLSSQPAPVPAPPAPVVVVAATPAVVVASPAPTAAPPKGPGGAGAKPTSSLFLSVLMVSAVFIAKIL